MESDTTLEICPVCGNTGKMYVPTPTVGGGYYHDCYNCLKQKKYIMVDGNLAMNSHEENMSEKDSQDAYQDFIIKERFPIKDEWDDIDKIYAKGQRDGARWMDSYLTGFADRKKAELLLMKKDIAFKAWKAAANAFRMYPDNKHTFFEYWQVEEKAE